MSAVDDAAAESPRAVLLPSLSVLGGSLGALLGSVVVRSLMARALSPAELGSLVLATALASAAGGIASLGISPAAGRRIAALRALGDEAGARVAARTAAWLGALGGLVAGALLALAAPWIAAGVTATAREAEPLAEALRALAPVALALPVGLAAVGITRGFGRTAARALVRDGGGGALRAVAVAVAVAAGAGATTIGLAFAGAVVVSEGAALAWCSGRGWLTRLRTSSARWDRPLTGGLRPFVLLELLNQLGQWMDVIVLGVLAPPAVVGGYGVARSVTRALSLLTSAPTHAFLPAATQAVRRGDEAGFARLYRRSRLTALALVWLPLGICLLVPRFPVVLLAGEAYASAATALRLLAATVLVGALAGFMGQALVARGAEKEVAAVETGALSTSLALLLGLVPLAGAEGAAWALLATELLRGATLVLLVARQAPLRRLADHLPAALVLALAVTAGTSLVVQLAGESQSLVGLGLAAAGSALGALLLAGALLRGG